MSDLLSSLKGLKDKLNNIESTFTETTNILEETRKPIKERLEDKYKDLVNLQSRIIKLDIGGCTNIELTSETINNSKFPNILQNEIKNYTSGGEPIFIDMSVAYFTPIMEIMRQSCLISDEKMITIVIDCDKDILQDEIMLFFTENQTKIIDKCDFVYSSKTLEHKNLLDIEKKRREMTAKIWDKKYKIKCYKCGKENDGTYNRIKNSSSTRSDEFVIDGHHASCKACDPTGTYSA